MIDKESYDREFKEKKKLIQKKHSFPIPQPRFIYFRDFYRGEATAREYNPKIPPFQHYIFRNGQYYPESPETRELLLRESSFIMTHIRRPVLTALMIGWIYEPANKPFEQIQPIPFANFKPSELTPEVMEIQTAVINKNKEIQAKIDKYNNEFEKWDKELELLFTDWVSKAFAINTAFLCSIEDKYYVFTPSDIVALYYNHNTREIEEVYFKMTVRDEVVDNGMYTREMLPIDEKGEIKLHQSEIIVGFLTNFSKDKERPIRSKFTTITTQKTVKRKCAVLTPLKSPRSILGDCMFFSEMETALEKLRIRFYEQVFMHKGGQDNTIILPQMENDSQYYEFLSTFKEGWLSRGLAIEADLGNYSVNDLYQLHRHTVPNIPFDDINTHLSEDARLPKQSVEGVAMGSGFSGIPAVIQEYKDQRYQIQLLPIIEQAIKVVNEVFFNQNPETYEIRFNDYPPVIPLLMDSVQAQQGVNLDLLSKFKKGKMDVNIEPERSLMGETIDSVRGQSLTQPLPKNPVTERNIGAFKTAHSIELKKHSVNDVFVEFIGNMFQAGEYYYPDGKTIEYTEKDIKKMTERDVKQFYLSVDHNFDDLNLLNEGVGYGEVIGYDNDLKGDITRVKIKKDIWEKVFEKKEVLNVSPEFIMKETNSGEKDIFIKALGILKDTIPLSKLSNKDTYIVKIDRKQR